MKVAIHDIAQVAHEVNRAYCEATGDHSQVPWEEAPAWQRDSAIAGVQTVLTNPTITPEEQHETWSAHKRAEGWKHGDVKDPVKQTHPCLVAYDKLPKAQRVKDHLFGAVVRALR